MDDDSFADLLLKYIGKTGYSYGQLADRSGLKKTTISNWANGYVKKPRQWQDVAKLASALNLKESEATSLLIASNHQSLAELLLSLGTDGEDKKLLDPWATDIYHRQRHAPFQAIADIPHFVGRDEVLNTLLVELRREHHETIYSLEGMGGSGKTALAAHLAHLLKPHLPDGILWARVDTSNAMSVLSAFAAAYDRDVSQYSDLDSRSQVVRDILANKRAVMVLDNAQNDSQLNPFLPPTGPCAVIVTTRQQELWATRAAQKLHIGSFDPVKGEAFELFSKILGVSRAEKEQVTLVQVADLLGHLPLAVDIIARWISYEPDLPVSHFLSLLQQEKERLDALSYGEQSVRLSFSLSYSALPPETQSVFASLGVFGGEDFSSEAVAHVTKYSRTEVDEMLRKLAAMSLVQRSRNGRYQIHPLLSAFAKEHLSDQTVYKRMIDYFVEYLEDHQRDYIAIEADFGNIQSALDMALANGMDSVFVRGSNYLEHYLTAKGLYDKSRELFQKVEDIVRENDNLPALAVTLLNQGRTAERQGRYSEAEAYYTEGVSLAQSPDLKQTKSELLIGMGVALAKRGGFAQARACFADALAIAQASGNNEVVIHALQNLAANLVKTGEQAKAGNYYQDALVLAREINDRERAQNILMGLGSIALRRGSHEEARKYYEEALTIARELDHKEATINLNSNLGATSRLVGDMEDSRKYYQDALTLARQLNYPEKIGTLAGNLGNLAVAEGDHGLASSYFEEALQIARQLDNPWLIGGILIEWGELYLEEHQTEPSKKVFAETLDIGISSEMPDYEGQALWGLARVAFLEGDTVRAQERAERCLAIFEETRQYAAAAVKQWLDTHFAVTD